MYERFVEPFIEHQGERRTFWLRKPRPIGRRILLARAGRPIRNDSAENRIVILLDGSRAFGTGGHGTTEGCLVALEERVGGGEEVLDAGTGTGILAIAAARLGACRVAAVDISPAACDETRRNVLLNDVGAAVEVFEGGVETVPGRFGLVVANLRTPILVTVMPSLADRSNPGGMLILSGILERETVPFLSFLERFPVDIVEIKSISGWSTLVARRPPIFRNRVSFPVILK